MKLRASSLLFWLIALVLSMAFPSFPTESHAAPPQKCGVWRWDIKTLSDEDATSVNFVPSPVTIRRLRGLEEPEELKGDTPRIPPTEYQVFRIRARLLAHKWVCCREKDDGDYHLVVADPRSRRRTMVAEIADPDCPGARESARVGALRAVRQEYDTVIGRPPRGRFALFEDPPLLFVTGVAFFDEVHGQRGVAPNGIELHPVLDIEEVP